MQKAWQVCFNPRKAMGTEDLKEDLEIRKSLGFEIKRMKNLSKLEAR